MSDPGPRGELPLVAVLGRPNVGKSTLFNRLVGRRAAIATDEPGVTRDRRYGEVEWGGRAFRLVDTGGLDPSARQGLLAGIRRQAQRALGEAQLVLFVVDAREGPAPADHDIARDLHRLGKPVLVVANKVDGPAAEAQVGPVYELGLPEVVPVSATHGRGIADLLDAVVARLGLPGAPPEAAEAAGAPEATERIRLAFAGKPNAGKSSLVNRIVGDERVVVDEAPGTTRDPVDTPLEHGGRPYLLVDTAGIRKHRTAYGATERIAVEMAKRSLERAHVVALVIDGREGPTEQDARLAGEIDELGRALLLVIAKADLLDRAAEERARTAVRETLAHVDWAPVLLTSAHSGRNVGEILAAAARVFADYSRRVPTGSLNRFFEQILAHHPPPHYKGRAVRLYYIAQPETQPPTFVVQANFPEAVPFAYRRYLVHQIREHFGFRGTPIRLVCRRRPRASRRSRSQAKDG